jgi:hypothetical protein
MTNRDFALVRLDWPEGPLLEKKSERDDGDWPKTLVAFANSTRAGERALLLIGASNHPPHRGISTAKAVDEIQIKISNIAADKCYPPIKIEFAHLVLDQAGKECHLLAVVVPPSEQPPHFAGGAYVRDGSKSRPASKDIYAELIASHHDTARRLLAWKKRQLQWKLAATNGIYYLGNATVMDCTGTSAQIQDDTTGFSWPIPISDISFLDRSGLPPVLEVRYWAADRELIEYMLSRWLTFIATQNPIYHAQVEYIHKQAEMHPELFEPVTGYMVARGNTSKPLLTLHADLKKRRAT